MPINFSQKDHLSNPVERMEQINKKFTGLIHHTTKVFIL